MCPIACVCSFFVFNSYVIYFENVEGADTFNKIPNIHCELVNLSTEKHTYSTSNTAVSEL